MPIRATEGEGYERRRYLANLALIPYAALSDKDILLRITKERGLSGETVSSIIGVIQQGVALQHEK